MWRTSSPQVFGLACAKRNPFYSIWGGGKLTYHINELLGKSFYIFNFQTVQGKVDISVYFLTLIKFLCGIFLGHTFRSARWNISFKWRDFFPVEANKKIKSNRILSDRISHFLTHTFRTTVVFFPSLPSRLLKQTEELFILLVTCVTKKPLHSTWTGLWKILSICFSILSVKIFPWRLVKDSLPQDKKHTCIF